jgi:predicted HD superfamily hydrolase involved in NAD metabolism
VARTSPAGELLSLSGSEFLHLCRAVRARTAIGRYRHCASVARTAEKLAVRYGAPSLKARVAGILHDIARLWKNEDLLAYAAAHAIPISADARAMPVLLHAPVGADVACREFGMCDREVLGAIARHTVAVPNMTDLEKILYLADTIEPSRKFEGREVLESAAFRSLDEGLFLSVQESLKYLMLRHVPIAQETIQLYNQLVRRDDGAS